MGLFKQLNIIIFIIMGGKLDIRGFPRGWLFFFGPLTDEGLLGSPYSQHEILWQVRGEPQYLETFRAGAPGSILSHLGLAPPKDRDGLGDLKESWFILFSN